MQNANKEHKPAEEYRREGQRLVGSSACLVLHPRIVVANKVISSRQADAAETRFSVYKGAEHSPITSAASFIGLITHRAGLYSIFFSYSM